MALKKMTSDDMEDALRKMTLDQHEHLRDVICTLLQCYTNDDMHALLLVTGDNDPHMTIIAVNSTDMEAASLLEAADKFMNFRLLDEAPPKEMLN